MAEKKRKKKRVNYRFYIFILLLLLLVGLVANAGLRFIGSPLDPKCEDVYEIEIPSGSTTNSIGTILEENGIISDAMAFKIATRISGDTDYKAGVYELSPSMSMDEIRDILLKGVSANTVTLVIPEGYTLHDIARTVEENGVCSADAFLEEAAHGEFEFAFMDQTLQSDLRLEGFLFPDTYDVYKGDDPHRVIQRMLTRFEEVYGELYESAKDNPVMQQYNVLQITTVASMIQREAFLDADRAPIASVIYNRLNMGMKMQFNTTVEYILGEVRDLTFADLEIDNPYNTYKYAGLPIGPIANPGRASLEAAMNPADTKYVYFVTSDKGDNSMAFSETYEEFLKDKDAWKASR